MNIIDHLLKKNNLSYEQMQDIMHNIMHGNCSGEWIAAFLVSMRAKGISVDELLASVDVMRKIVTPITLNCINAVDVVGTGGDGINTFNISTASMIVAASCGAKVAKHGNRGVSSKSGSADVLEILGININQNATLIAKSIEECGLGFMFAPHHHPAMKYVASVRKILGIRTFFNILGPLTNPANVKRMLIGVYSKEWLMPIAQVLLKLNFEHAMVVHADNGMDEVSSSGITYAFEVKNNNIIELEINPEIYGFKPFNLDEISATDSKHSAQIIKHAFNANQGAAFDMIAINAGVVLYVGALAANIEEGVKMAINAMLNGKASEKLQEFIKYTSDLK